MSIVKVVLPLAWEVPALPVSLPPAPKTEVVADRQKKTSSNFLKDKHIILLL
jgi:hypothetical protein